VNQLRTIEGDKKKHAPKAEIIVEEPVEKKHRLPPSERVYADDPVFFHKAQISVGSQLWHFGRLDPKSLWEVYAIISYNRKKQKHIQTTSKLLDVVYMRRVNSENETRYMTFGYLSYSALWRLAE
jgi:hypothetical protein